MSAAPTKPRPPFSGSAADPGVPTPSAVSPPGQHRLGQEGEGSTIDLPMPPSVNSIWRVTRGGKVHKDRRYDRWITDAGWELVLQKPRRFPGKVRIAILVRRGKFDLDNMTKAPIDLLQRHGVIKNDKLVEALTVGWSDDVPACRVTITEA